MKSKYWLMQAIAAVLLLFGSLGCETDDVRGRPDPFNEIESVEFSDGKVVQRTKERLGDDIYKDIRIPEKEKDEVIPDPVANDKLHPLIRNWFSEKAASEKVDVVISFQDRYPMPRFPNVRDNEARTSAFNQRALNETERLVSSIQEGRQEEWNRLEKLLTEYNATVTDRFWIVNALAVTATVADLRNMLQIEELLYIEPVQTEDRPPQNGNNNDDVQDGRQDIVSDPYFNLGQTTGYIGLFDSGVRTTHDLFNSPDHIDFMYDCVDGGSNCNDSSNPNFNPDDDCWNHGTSTAAILTGNDRHGNAFRGVTAITVDNLKVYPNGCGGLHTTATLRAFERSIEILDRVLVAEMQGSGSHWSSISQAADNAFNAGAVVIAANGNFGPNASTVRTPANAHRVIGIGNFDVQTNNAITSQSRGPTGDNRFKPDVRCPTNTETASSGGASSFRVFGGTSGATPYGAGAAALVRNFMRGNSFSIDPGKVYSYLIMSGQNPYPFNNDIGAGDLELPVNGQVWWGKVNISEGQVIEIPINVTQSNRNVVDAAIWWPENLVELDGFIPLIDPHDDVDLRIVDPGNTVRDFSLSIPSIFERVRYTGSVSTGTWKVRINGYDVRGTQTVYWVAAVHSKSGV